MVSYYLDGLNVGLLTAALINAYYTADQAQFKNYGQIGAQYLMQLVDGFGFAGRKLDHNGLPNNWWSNQSYIDYKKREECIIKQYGNYTFEGVQLNGEETALTNINTNVAIFQTYKAYCEVINDDIPIYKLGNYSKKQLFWIASAQYRCDKYTKEEAVSRIEEGKTVSKFTVNGMVSNQEAFAKDFECLKDVKMNPSNKCVYW
ncbi:Nep2 (predicted) [Pycnogonum litorale]